MFPPPVKEIEIVLYTKPDCPLCDKAKELLEITGRGMRIRITEVNILRESAVFQLYQDRIPVFRFPDGTLLEAPIRRDGLTRVLRRLVGNESGQPD